MAEEKKIVAFKVVVDNSDLDRSAEAAARRVDELKAKQKELDRTTDSGRIAYQKYSAEIKKAQGDLRTYTDLQKKSIIATEAAEGSNEQLRAQLSLVTAQYNKLSAEQRENSEAGKALGQQVADLTAKLKENESAVGDNRRNVGNYEEALRNATGYTDQNRKANLALQNQMEASARSTAALAGGFALLSQLIGDNEKAQNALKVVTLAVAAATVTANIAKEKGAILDTISFAKTKALVAIQGAYNTVVAGGTVAANAFRVALAAIPIAAIVAGIATLVTWLRNQEKATNDQKDAQSELNEELERTKELNMDIVRSVEGMRRSQLLRIKELEKTLELQKAQGASEEQLYKTERAILQERLDFYGEIRRNLKQGSDERKEYARLYEQTELDLKILDIERSNRIAKERKDFQDAEKERKKLLEERDEADIFAFTNTQDLADEYKQFFESIGMDYETFGEAKVRIEQESADAITRILEEQDQKNEEFFQNNEERDAQRAERLNEMASLAMEYSSQIGKIFADSIDEAGFQLENFFQRLMTLNIEILQRQLLAAIAEIYFTQAPKGLVGIAQGALLTSIVVGATEAAKAALSKPVRFEQGGEFDPFGIDVGGRLHSQGGTKYYGEDGNVIELERGEKMFIANRKTSALVKSIAALNMQMGGRGLSGSSSFLADGGFASRGVVDAVNGQFSTAQLASEIVRSLPEFRVSVSEINRVQGRVSVTDSVTSL